MGAKVIVLVLILVIWAVLVSASAHAARVETEEAQDQPRANVTRIVLGAAATQDDSECESPRPNWIQHGPARDQVERAVCPNV